MDPLALASAQGRPRRIFGLAILGIAFAPLHTRSDLLREQPFSGIELTHWRVSEPRGLNLHVAQIDLHTSGLRFKLSPHRGGLDTQAQTTLDFLNQENAQLAINCHFYLPFPALPNTDVNVAGLAVSNGDAYSPFEPQPLRPEGVDQRYAIVPFAPAINIDPLNRAEVVHMDATDPAHFRIIESVTLWNAFAGSEQIVTEGCPSIPRYTGLPSGLMPALGYDDQFSWYDVRRARTIAGLSRDRSILILMVVDEISGSLGMTVHEAANFLIREYGVWDAINLDGDGSTTMVIQDSQTQKGRFVNSPSDGLLGRPVGNSLAIFARSLDAAAFAIARAVGGGFALSWSANSLEWKLERMTLAGETGWHSVPIEPERRAGRWEVLTPASMDATLFRLHRKEMSAVRKAGFPAGE